MTPLGFNPYPPGVLPGSTRKGVSTLSHSLALCFCLVVVLWGPLQVGSGEWLRIDSVSLAALLLFYTKVYSVHTGLCARVCEPARLIHPYVPYIIFSNRAASTRFGEITVHLLLIPS